jgi:hypothetical protein
MRAGRAATPFALIVLAVAALAYAYVVDRGHMTETDGFGTRRAGAAHARDVLPGFDSRAASRIELARADERLVLERAGDAGDSAWTMLAPWRDRADPAAVDALLQELGVAIRLRDVPSTAGAGFDAPRVRGEVRSGPVTYRFALGSPAPVPEGASYMRVEGEGTFVVGSALTDQLLRGAQTYRDRALVPVGASATQRVEVRTGGAGGFTLVRVGATFRVDGGLRASRDGLARVFAALAGWRADGFVADADADRALAGASDVLTVALEPKDAAGPRVELRAGGTCPASAEDAVVVRIRPDHRAACVPSNAIEPLREKGDALVDTRALVAHPDEVEELRLEAMGRGGHVQDVARRGPGWHERSPVDRDLAGADADPVNAAVERLAGLRATDGVAPAVVNGTMAVRTRARVVAVDGTTETVEWGAPDAQGVAVLRRADDGATFTVAADDLRAIEGLLR